MADESHLGQRPSARGPEGRSLFVLDYNKLPEAHECDVSHLHHIVVSKGLLFVPGLRKQMKVREQGATEGTCGCAFGILFDGPELDCVR
jgi:hypothetical protein